jgi:hypothetical protein
MLPQSSLLAVVCLYTALIAFKPSEPFLFVFFECIKGIPAEAINANIFPVWSYAYLALLPPLAALAELVGHRHVVLLGAIGRLLTIIIMLVPFSTCSVEWMQVSQVSIAVGFAAHPALSAIMYRGLPRVSYVRAAGLVACVGVVAETSASLLGQLLISRQVPLDLLFLLSFVFTGAAVLAVFLLPARQTMIAKDALLAPCSVAARVDWSVGINVSRSAAGGCSSSDDSAPAAVNGRPMATTPISGSILGSARADVAAAQLAAEHPSRSVGANPSSAAGLVASDGALETGATASSPLLATSSQARLVCTDTAHVLRHSGAVYYYAWIAVATAVHHLVVTYWQSGIPLPPHPVGTPSPPPHSLSFPRANVNHVNVNHVNVNVPTCPLPDGPSANCDHIGRESINGYIQALASLLGGLAALLPPLLERLSSDAIFHSTRESFIVGSPLVLAALLYTMTIAETEQLYALGYVSFHVGFEMMRVLCEAEGARCIAATSCQGQPRFAAVSGLNTTITLVLQVLLQMFFTFPRDFQVLASILFGLFVAYVAAAALRVLLAHRNSSASAGGSGSNAVNACDVRGGSAADADDGRPYMQHRE